MPQDKTVSGFIAQITVTVTAVNRYGDELEESVIRWSKSLPAQPLSQIVEKLETIK